MARVPGAYDKLHQAYVDLFAWLEKEGYSIEAPFLVRSRHSMTGRMLIPKQR